MTQFNISITSDIVCPWCYIGHTRLSRAITNHQQKHPEDTFHMSYIPFYLNPPPHLLQGGPAPPMFPVKSAARKEYYAAKFGGSRAQQIFGMLDQVGKGEGLDFKFGGNTGSSRNGHRLVHYAQTHGGEKAQNDTMLALWRRYFEQEVDITTLETLTEVGVESGLGSEAEIKDFLESGKGADVVDRQAMDASDQGIGGVPYYVIQDMWDVSGAQEPRAFERLFEKYKEMEESGKIVNSKRETEAGKGDACL